MASKSATQTKTDELELNEKISVFIQKYRKAFFIGFGLLILILAAFIITSLARGRLLSKAMSQIDGFNRRFEELKPYIGSDDPEAMFRQVELVLLLEELKTFESKNTGYAAGRSFCISAEIYVLQKMWAAAEEDWVNAAKATSKTYLAPFCLFNAAMAAEEQGNTDSAITYYSGVLDYATSFPAAPRAQFSVGRLEESRGNNDAALEAYRNVLSKWPEDQVWPNLAQSRILVLSK